MSRVSRGRSSGGGLLVGAARRRVRGWQRELERPWVRGRPGRAAEAGRWIGLGLAVGAFVAGVGAALYTEWRRR